MIPKLLDDPFTLVIVVAAIFYVYRAVDEIMPLLHGAPVNRKRRTVDSVCFMAVVLLLGLVHVFLS